VNFFRRTMGKKFHCRLVISVTPANPLLATHTLFDISYREPKHSPIDEFHTRLFALNKLAPKPQAFDVYQGQLILLGVVAAVESYLRTLFRRVIAIDEISRESVHGQNVSYGAAMHLSKQLLPEAILERIAFVSKKSIGDAVRELLGVKGELPSDLETVIDDYARICQLRHCAVHRFGKLGASNAIALGLGDHKSLMEKPLTLDYTALQNIVLIATGLVKTINNFLFNELLSRIDESMWSGRYASDKALFRVYYDMFAERISVNRTAQPKVVYMELQRQRRAWAST
jgi:hypothetical protein